MSADYIPAPAQMISHSHYKDSLTHFFSLLLAMSACFGMVLRSLLLVLDLALSRLSRGGVLLLVRLRLSLDLDLEFLECLEPDFPWPLDGDGDLRGRPLDRTGDFERDFVLDLDLAFSFRFGLSLDLELELELDLDVLGDLGGFTGLGGVEDPELLEEFDDTDEDLPLKWEWQKACLFKMIDLDNFFKHKSVYLKYTFAIVF